MFSDPKSIIENLDKRMESSITNLKHTLSGLRAGRASTSLLEPVKVEVYGSIMPISQLGTVSAPEPRMLTVQVWDKANTKAVEKAILNAGLGLNPIAESQTIRIPLPDLSEERRKELAKKASEYVEHSKVAIRNVRRDGIDELKKLEKSKNISEDELKSYSEEVQKLTDKYVKKTEEVGLEKAKEIMGG